MKNKLWNKIILEELDKKHIGDIKTKEVVFLCALGRLVKNKKSFSYNILVLAPSSSGKDHLVSSVLELFPEQDYENFKRISPTALNYLHTLEKEPDFSYDGKILYLEEIEENVLNNEVMKGFTAGEKEISICAITGSKGKGEGKGKGIEILKVKGHPCVFTTTATTTPTEEIRNRFNILGLDLSEEQTERTFIDESLEYSEEVKAFLSKLKPYEIEIPKKMYSFIKKKFPRNKIRYRRDFPRFLDFIKAVALFNQADRGGHHGGIRIAEPEDYNLAKDIFMNAFTGVRDIPLRDIANRIIKVLETEDKPLSARELFACMKGYVAIQNLYPYLRDLTSKEIIDEITDRDTFDSPVTKYLLSQEYKDNKPFKLPVYEEE